MKYLLFGNSGLRVSQVCLGTMTFGAKNWGTNKKTSEEILNHYFEMGGNFLDTANVYAGGESESLIGKWMKKAKGSRHKTVLATKYTLSTNPQNPNASGSNKKNLIHSVEESLQRLQTSYVDVLWVHSYDAFTPIEEVMQSLHYLVSTGKVLTCGVSNWAAWQVSKANTFASGQGLTPFSGTQIYYNLIERSAERELLPMATAMGLTTTVWSPLAGGLLTGKYYHQQKGLLLAETTKKAAGRKTKNSAKLSKLPRLQQKESIALKNKTGREGEIVATLLGLAKEANCTPHGLALAWMVQKKNVGRVVPIVGAKSVLQLRENIEGLQLNVHPEILAALNKVSMPQLGYPHDFLKLQSSAIYGDSESNVF